MLNKHQINQNKMLNTKKIKQDFPIFNRKINGKKITYLDSAASTQKPSTVIDSIGDFYKNHYANIHRGVYRLSQEATDLYEQAHEKTSKFINAQFEEVVFTKGTTESLNLLAYSLDLKKGDEILLTQIEHHSNIVPWQFISKLKQLKLKFAIINKDGTLNIEDFKKQLNKKTKVVSVTGMSNGFGTKIDLKLLSKLAKENNSLFIVDGAQYVPHLGFNVKDIDVDFLAFSGHKMCGPTGIGVLYGKQELLNDLKPFNYGGDMIREVTFEDATWNNLPWKFEAGTPNIAGAIGMGKAIDYLNKIGMENIIEHDKKLTELAYKTLNSNEDIEIYGPTPDKRGSVLPFNMKGIHTHDVASILDSEGVCVRGGHHCTMPTMKLFGIQGSTRASFYIYNDKEDIEILDKALQKVRKVFKK